MKGKRCTEHYIIIFDQTFDQLIRVLDGEEEGFQDPIKSNKTGKTSRISIKERVKNAKPSKNHSITKKQFRILTHLTSRTTSYKLFLYVTSKYSVVLVIKLSSFP